MMDVKVFECAMPKFSWTCESCGLMFRIVSSIGGTTAANL